MNRSLKKRSHKIKKHTRDHKKSHTKKIIIIGEAPLMYKNEQKMYKQIVNKEDKKSTSVDGININTFDKYINSKKQYKKKNDIEIYKETLVNNFNKKRPDIEDTDRCVNWMKAHGAISYSIGNNMVHWIKLQNICRNRLLYPPNNYYNYHRVGYNIDWISLPKSTIEYFLNSHIQRLLHYYMDDPYIISIELHVNADTETGKQAQRVHKDVTKHGIVTMILSLRPSDIVGTYFRPGSHINNGMIIYSNDHHLCQRVTYTHNALLFDSFVYHYGSSSNKSIYKFMITFANKSLLHDKELFLKALDIKEPLTLSLKDAME